VKINIVTEPAPGWVLRMIAENWADHLPDCSITSMAPDTRADINFYVNWDIYKESSAGIDVGYFTHRELNDKAAGERFDIKARQMDYCIGMCDNTLNQLPLGKSSIIKPGIGSQYKGVKSCITFGVVGRAYDSGRKQFKIINELKGIPSARIYITNGKLTDDQMPGFYEDIDYLLVLSNNEGGPLPVLEAISNGVPVIAPNVGWCWDYPVIKYEGINDLRKIITVLSSQTDTEKVWIYSSNKLLEIFKTLHNEIQIPN